MVALICQASPSQHSKSNTDQLFISKGHRKHKYIYMSVCVCVRARKCHNNTTIKWSLRFNNHLTYKEAVYVLWFGPDPNNVHFFRSHTTETNLTFKKCQQRNFFVFIKSSWNRFCPFKAMESPQIRAMHDEHSWRTSDQTTLAIPSLLVLLPCETLSACDTLFSSVVSWFSPLSRVRHSLWIMLRVTLLWKHANLSQCVAAPTNTQCRLMLTVALLRHWLEWALLQRERRLENILFTLAVTHLVTPFPPRLGVDELLLCVTASCFPLSGIIMNVWGCDGCKWFRLIRLANGKQAFTSYM